MAGVFPGVNFKPTKRSELPENIQQSLVQVPVKGVKGKDGVPKDWVNTTGYNPKQQVWVNAPMAVLYEQAILSRDSSFVTSTGALATVSFKKTGRSPADKRVVEEPSSVNDVWWGPVNTKLPPASFLQIRERALDYLNVQDDLYVVDALAGWDEKSAIKCRIICTRPYHAVFMLDMLIRPTAEQMKKFVTPDYTIFNAGVFPASRHVPGLGSECVVTLHLARMEQVILGTQYAGEMKKGILTLWMYHGPKHGMLTMHASCTEGNDGRSTVFFGLSGTGKTTLCADPKRKMIGDDEHVWSSEGVFNIEGGCYAKAINLRREQEPEIYDSIKYGAILENVILDSKHEVQYDDKSITENTRVAFPLEHIPNAKFPAITGHPTNIVLLTCDAFGVLPPVSKLTSAQAMYQFVAGYTAKVAGTEMGITEPVATFSPCFGGPFLVLHPPVYAELLAKKLEQHTATAWLVNTGWSGGKYGVGARMKLKFTRAIVDAINEGVLVNVPTKPLPGWNLLIPDSCPGVPSEMLTPVNTWKDKKDYYTTLNNLADMFNKNFEKYKAKASAEVIAASPQRVPVPKL